MALIGAILVEIKIIEFLCERSLRGGDRYAMRHGTCQKRQMRQRRQRRRLQPFGSQLTYLAAFDFT